MMIELTLEEMQYAAKIGYYREYDNTGVSNIADYDTKRFKLTSLQAHRLGVMTEIAVGKALGLNMLTVPLDVWVSFHPKEHKYMYDGKADILDRFEVRRCESAANPIPLRKKDLEHQAYVVQGYVDYIKSAEDILVPNAVNLIGWSDSVADWPCAEIPSWSNGSSRVVKNKRPMEQLEGITAVRP